MGSRVSEGPQRPSPRVPLYLRSTACSEANSVRHRPAAAADRSPKVSPRGGSQERKRGTRVVELETKLSKAQGELKKLKERLAAAEAAKVEAEQALAKAKKRTPAAAVNAKAEEETSAQALDSRPEDARQNVSKEESVTSQATMDVFEVVVPAEPVPPEDEVDGEQWKEEKVTEKQEEETKAMIEKLERHEDNDTAAFAVAEEEEKELVILKAKLLEKEREAAVLLEENTTFKIKAEEEAKQIAESSRAKQEQLTAQLNSMEKELEDSKTNEQQLSSQLEAAEGSKATLEMELKRMKVQTEQWRKAAEAAAEVLAAGNDASEEMGDRRLAERCSSMNKHLGVDYRSWESPSIDEDMDEDGSGGGGGRRMTAGVRMFGNLWKKNQHK